MNAVLTKTLAVAPALALVAGLQLAALGWMVWDRIALLKSGREITLPIVPVDPRDLFKGDYVRLGYPISRVSMQLFTGDTLGIGKPIYITLEKSPADDWVPKTITQQRPEGSMAADRIVLKARYTRLGRSEVPGRTEAILVQYGIERYYVPEGTGPKLEQAAREKKLAALVAVDGKGRAAIKGLMIDGKKVYDEPLL
jgi:uncharacterized membrane-anchored protein